MGSGELYKNFSHNVTKLAKDMGVAASKEVLYDEVRGNFGAFLNDRPEGTPFCYWWGADKHPQDLGAGLRQGSLGAGAGRP